jgi:hypothetical protein
MCCLLVVQVVPQ